MPIINFFFSSYLCVAENTLVAVSESISPTDWVPFSGTLVWECSVLVAIWLTSSFFGKCKSSSIVKGDHQGQDESDFDP